MGTDGGMHEVFVAALQGGRPIKDQDGEIRGFVPVSAPGTIPPTVNPPSNVVLANASAGTEAANVPLPRAVPRALNRTPTRTASVEPAAPASRNFLGSLFTSNNSDTKSSSPSLLDRAARVVGLRSSSSTAEAAEVPAAPPNKPALTAKPMPLIATAATQPKPRPVTERTESPARIAHPTAAGRRTYRTGSLNCRCWCHPAATAAAGAEWAHGRSEDGCQREPALRRRAGYPDRQFRDQLVRAAVTDSSIHPIDRSCSRVAKPAQAADRHASAY
jgi:hypothetical protein